MRFRTPIVRVLAVVIAISGGLAAPVAALGYVAGCNAWHYGNITYTAALLDSIWTKNFVNTTGINQNFTASASNGGTLGITLTGGANADVGVIFASVKASASVAVAATITVGYTSGVSGTIPPHSTIHVYYGAYRVVANGDYYFMTPTCVKTAITRIKAKVPKVNTEGWVISLTSLAHDGS